MYYSPSDVHDHIPGTPRCFTADRVRGTVPWLCAVPVFTNGAALPRLYCGPLCVTCVRGIALPTWGSAVTQSASGR